MDHGADLGPVAFELVLFLAATSLVVPALRRARLSAVMGFLVIGVLLGPFGIGQLAPFLPMLGEVRLSEGEGAHWLAELGVVFLLFAIGLEVSLERLLALGRLVLGLGGLQLALSALAIGAVAFAFGNAWPQALVIGLALALSSTAVVLQLLAERRQLSGAVGRAGFSVLLLQDLAVVPILAVVGAISVREAGAAGGDTKDALVALATAAAALGAILLAGRFAMRPLLRWAASVDSREVFFATALLVVLGAAFAAQAAGLSMALGAFLAGVLLAGTEFRHQIEADLDPFKGLLLGLFFVTVGMRIDLAYLASDAFWVAAGVLGLFVVKAAIIAPLARAFGLSWPQSIELGFLLGQAGEFAFVVVALAQTGGVIPDDVARYMLLVVALSLFLTPVVAGLGVRIARRLPHGLGAPQQEAPRAGHVVIAGFGRVGRALAEILAAQDIRYVALEADTTAVAQLREENWPVHFGDASRRDVLASVGAGEATAIVVTMDRADAVERIVTEARAAWPQVPIYARARDAEQAKRLHKLGAALALPETVSATLQLGEALLNGLGLPDEAARRIIEERRDQEAARALADG